MNHIASLGSYYPPLKAQCEKHKECVNVDSAIGFVTLLFLAVKKSSLIFIPPKAWSTFTPFDKQLCSFFQLVGYTMLILVGWECFAAIQELAPTPKYTMRIIEISLEN